VGSTVSREKRARRHSDAELTQLLETLNWRIVYRYKQPFRDGSTNVVLEPLDFMALLAGFSLHASGVCEAHRYGGLERLCLYRKLPSQSHSSSFDYLIPLLAGCC
jgi:hypothetical protein